jgi:Flp pilus assembly protein TadG
VLPVLVMILFAIIQFSISYNQKQGLHAAAREGARYASLPTSTKTEIQARVNSALAGVTVTGTPTITITPDTDQPCLNHQGDSVAVQVSTTERVSVPLVFTRNVTLTGKGEFRCE